MTDADFTLPSLNPFLKLYTAPPVDGVPAWTLHHAPSNAYYRISWAEFECISRMARCRTAHELCAAVNAETTLRVDISDITALCAFLAQNGLIAGGAGAIPKSVPLWKRIMHGYLFFTIPLVRPERFLKASLPYVRLFLGRRFFMGMMLLLAVAAVMTMQRADEFLHTFAGFVSVEGIIFAALALAGVKAIHEMAHAYVAVREGVPVPHMGIAVMVLYPVLYTETTGGWRVTTRHGRMAIGLAGIMAELCVAAVALLLWNVAPAGSMAQALCFIVTAVALVSSLLVNLNPLMRFDGYYLLSDLMGIENLQARACAFARWWLRRLLFGWGDDAPEHLAPDKVRFLTVFGLALLVYRFLLFVGIALLVYHVFFKPLGLFLMLLELWWFIGLPVWGELRIWAARRKEILLGARGRMTLLAGFMIFLLMLMPVNMTVKMPAVIHARDYAAVHVPVAARVDEWHITEGSAVHAGQVLARLSSVPLERDREMARSRLEALESMARRAGTNAALLREQYAGIEQQIVAARASVAALDEQAQALVITAPFDGVARDVLQDVVIGQTVSPRDILMRIVGAGVAVTAYVTENDLPRMKVGGTARFRPDFDPGAEMDVTVAQIAPAAGDVIDWPELASDFGGSLAARRDAQSAVIKPMASYYRVELTTDLQATPARVMRGQVLANASAISPLQRFIKSLAGVIVRESGLN